MIKGHLKQSEKCAEHTFFFLLMFSEHCPADEVLRFLKYIYIFQKMRIEEGVCEVRPKGLEGTYQSQRATSLSGAVKVKMDTCQKRHHSRTHT